MAEQAKRKDVFTVIDKGEGNKAFWLKIGAAFENRDGSWNVLLDAFPVNGKLTIREPYDEAADRSNSRDRDERRDGDGGRGRDDRGGSRR